MTWAKLDDGTDEELEYLGHAAHRLFIDTITLSRRRNLGGRLVPAQLGPAMRRLHIPTKAIGELLAAGPEGEPLWLKEGDVHIIRNYEKFNPLTSTERVKKHRREKKRGETFPVTPLKQDVTPLVRASATGLETNSPLGIYPAPPPVPDRNENGTGLKPRRIEFPRRGYKGGEMSSLADHLPKARS